MSNKHRLKGREDECVCTRTKHEGSGGSGRVVENE